MADSSSPGGFGGTHIMYGVVIGDAIARGDLSQMKKVLDDGKKLLASQGDLKNQIANLEAAIEQVTRTSDSAAGGAKAAAPPNDGLFVVDVKALKLSPEQLNKIQQSIEEVVASSLADVDIVAKHGPGAFRPPITAGIIIRDI